MDPNSENPRPDADRPTADAEDFERLLNQAESLVVDIAREMGLPVELGPTAAVVETLDSPDPAALAETASQSVTHVEAELRDASSPPTADVAAPREAESGPDDAEVNAILDAAAAAPLDAESTTSEEPAPTQPSDEPAETIPDVAPLPTEETAPAADVSEGNDAQPAIAVAPASSGEVPDDSPATEIEEPAVGSAPATPPGSVVEASAEPVVETGEGASADTAEAAPDAVTPPEPIAAAASVGAKSGESSDAGESSKPAAVRRIWGKALAGAAAVASSLGAAVIRVPVLLLMILDLPLARISPAARLRFGLVGLVTLLMGVLSLILPTLMNSDPYGNSPPNGG